MPTSEVVRFAASGRGDEVPGLLTLPEDAESLLVLAHGAGAGMRHHFLESLSRELASVKVGTLRYQFLYMEQGSRRPDPQMVLTETVQFAVEAARKHAPGLPLLAGGKSMGGRMTSLAASESPLEGVTGLVFFGFPLHPPGKPGTARSKHLDHVQLPMLFLQGTRDVFADMTLLTQVVANVGSLATLHILDGADHSFHVLKRSGKSDSGVLSELARTVEEWASALHSGSS